jgi:hypothetical protein
MPGFRSDTLKNCTFPAFGRARVGFWAKVKEQAANRRAIARLGIGRPLSEAPLKGAYFIITRFS